LSWLRALLRVLNARLMDTRASPELPHTVCRTQSAVHEWSQAKADQCLCVTLLPTQFFCVANFIQQSPTFSNFLQTLFSSFRPTFQNFLQISPTQNQRKLEPNA